MSESWRGLRGRADASIVAVPNTTSMGIVWLSFRFPSPAGPGPGSSLAALARAIASAGEATTLSR